MDEGALIQAARTGDELAFDSLVGPLVDPAFRLAVVFLRDPNEAQDAVQEATLKAWRSLDRLRKDAAIRPWFLSIVAFTRTEPGIDERHDLQIDLDREMGKLPETDRAVLFLFFYLDLPLGEVGRILGISPQAAKSRVHRAVSRLRLGMVEVAK